jgi:transcriptional regulator with XRE-family HTH domain
VLKALRMARADAGLTISELAERAGVARDTISKAEKGQHSLQASTLHKIARALGKAPSELLAEEERLAPKGRSRSPYEPSLFNGLEEERRMSDFPGAAENLVRYCEHWQQRLAADDLDYRSLKEFFITATHWEAMLQAALQAELNQLGVPAGAESEHQGKSAIWRAYERYIDLGVDLAAAGHEKFDPALEEEKIAAEKRRAAFTLVRGSETA